MQKYEVMADCLLKVKKGSVVIVDERQLQYAREFLKAIEEKKKEKKKKGD